MAKAAMQQIESEPLEGTPKAPLRPNEHQADSFTMEPILEKNRNGRNVEIGKHYRRKRMVEVLCAQGLFSSEEAKALKHYRHHADIADKSPLKDSLANLMRISGGTGSGPTVNTLNAIRVRDDVERAAGSLVDILRAVVVDDISLTQWCVSRGKSVEKCRARRAGRVCTIEAPESALRIARMEIQMAAKRVQAELDA
jgi:hypothetical protein